MSDDKSKRYRFSVPAADTTVIEWMEAQDNVAFSLRTMIRAFVRQYGIKDATCLEFGESVKKRGRKPNSAKIKYENMMAVDIDDDDDIPQAEQMPQQMAPPPMQTPQGYAQANQQIPGYQSVQMVQPVQQPQAPASAPIPTPAPQQSAVPDQIDMNNLGL